MRERGQSGNRGQGAEQRAADAGRLYKCEIPFEVNPKIGFKESYRQFNARLKEWAAEMCFVVVASHWMIRVHGWAISKSLSTKTSCQATTTNLVASAGDFTRRVR